MKCVRNLLSWFKVIKQLIYLDFLAGTLWYYHLTQPQTKVTLTRGNQEDKSIMVFSSIRWFNVCFSVHLGRLWYTPSHSAPASDHLNKCFAPRS